MARQRLVLRHKYALGDTICFTGLVRDVHLNYPGQYDVLVDSHFREVWQNNPHARVITAKDRKTGPRIQTVDISYKQGILAAGRGDKTHMLPWYHRDFTEKTGIALPCRLPKGDYHLTDKEKEPIVEGRYWLMIAGYKTDMTNKAWWSHRYQEVVNALRKMGIWCVQAGVKHSNHRHPTLNNCLSMIGKYEHSRQFANLIYNADGVICPITAGMHLSACFDKPTVVLAGGREDPSWEAYSDVYGAFGPNCAPVKTEHRFLHTVGALHCCEKKGCWKKRVVPIEPRDHKQPHARQLCLEPRHQQGEDVALCMDMITVDHVMEAVMGYYEDGKIPPIGKPKGTYRSKDSTGDEDFPAPRLVPVEMVDKVAKGIAAATPVSTKPKLVRPPAVSRPAPRIPAAPRPPKAPPAGDMKLFDHPIIGGKYTVCVLCYGPYPELAKRCITSILDTVPRERLDLRVACNEVSSETIRFLRNVPTTKVYINDKNRKKYPVMREMFWDATCPINTNYVLWFDDDAQVVDPNWLVRLTEVIAANHPHGNRMFGWRMMHDLKIFAKGGHRPDAWFREADWYNGRHFRVRRPQIAEAPNGTVIEFAVGWFWALSMEAIKKGNIPDLRLNHNGGDITIGEQVHQAGFKIKQFNKDKVFVWCPKKEDGGRRGYEEGFPWAKKRPAAARR